MATDERNRQRTSQKVPPPLVQSSGLSAWIENVGELGKSFQAITREYRKLVDAGTADAHRLSSWLIKQINVLKRVEILSSSTQNIIAALNDLDREQLLTLETDLKEAIARKEWTIDGNWPTFFVQHVVRVEIDEGQRVVRVGSSIIHTIELSAIVKTLDQQIKELFPKQFDRGRFLDNLVQCYDRLRSPAERAVSIWAIYKEMLIAGQAESFWRSGNPRLFRPFNEQTFRACMTAILEQDAITTKDGRVLKVLAPIRPEDGMYLFQPLDNRFAFVGRVEFQKD